MHRATTAAAQTAVPPDDFRKGGLDVTALRKDVAVASVAREKRVLSCEMRANPDGYGFLPSAVQPQRNGLDESNSSVGSLHLGLDHTEDSRHLGACLR